MSTEDRPTQPIDHDDTTNDHTEDAMTTPTTSGAPPTTPDTPAGTGTTGTTGTTEPVSPAPSRSPRIGTIVWGLVVAAIGVGILAFALDVAFDVQLASIVVIAAAGVLLLVGSLATSRRRHD